MTNMNYARKPEDPFDFHLYVGCSREAVGAIQPVIEVLRNQWNVRCYSRFDGQNGSEEDVDVYGIRCERCLLYVTPEYVEDPRFEQEIDVALEKAQFSADMLMVLADSVERTETLKRRQLQNYVVEWPSTLQEQTEMLFSWLQKDPALNPIQQMPDKISGYFEAFVYYYGYLNWVLRDHRAKMKDAAKLWPDFSPSGASVALPMIIVVPKSCRAPTLFDIDGKMATCHNKYVVSAGHHGGSMNRDYKTSVMELVENVDENVESTGRKLIYFSGEFPACLQTVCETWKSGQAGLTEEHLDRISAEFYETLQSLLCHPDNRHCTDQYRLVLWPDSTVDLHTFLLPVLRNAVEEKDVSSLVVGSPPAATCGQVRQSSFEQVDRGHDPGDLYKGAGYEMRDVTQRGVCLIISVGDEAGQPNIEEDVCQLRKLFHDEFDFDVRDHRGLKTTAEVDDLLCAMSRQDHDRYDAFVCYISGRGRLGCIRDEDGKQKPIIDLANLFNERNCPSLARKPKLFLLQTIDDDVETSDNEVFNVEEQIQIMTLNTRQPHTPQRDAAGTHSSADSGETLVPRDPDVIVSYAAFSPAAAAADRCSGNPSLYVRALLKHLRPGHNVVEGLNKLKQQLLYEHVHAHVLETADRPLVFPRKS